MITAQMVQRILPQSIHVMFSWMSVCYHSNLKTTEYFPLIFLSIHLLVFDLMFIKLGEQIELDITSWGHFEYGCYVIVRIYCPWALYLCSCVWIFLRLVCSGPGLFLANPDRPCQQAEMLINGGWDIIQAPQPHKVEGELYCWLVGNPEGM